MMKSQNQEPIYVSYVSYVFFNWAVLYIKKINHIPYPLYLIDI